MTDAELMERISRGDQQALEILFDRYYSLCIYSARNLLNSHEDAEEAVVDAFAGLWQARGYYDGDRSSVKTWLLLFVRRRAVDILRKRKPQMTLEEQLLMIPCDTDTTVETRELLRHLIGSLEPEQKELFYRRFVYNESYAAIARQMNKSVDAVKSMLYRMRSYFKETMAEERSRWNGTL